MHYRIWYHHHNCQSSFSSDSLSPSEAIETTCHSKDKKERDKEAEEEENTYTDNNKGTKRRRRIINPNSNTNMNKIEPYIKI